MERKGRGVSLSKYMDEHQAQIDWDRKDSSEPEYDYDEDENEKVLRVPIMLVSDSCREATNHIRMEEYKSEHYDEIKEEVEKDIKNNNGIIPDAEEEIKDRIESNFYDDEYSDDYCPIWNTIWEFPSSYDVETLNDAGINGVVFFDLKCGWKTETFVGLTTCGMDMSPSLYYAFLKYSDVTFNRAELIRECGRKGWDYCKYVIGNEKVKDFILILTKGMSKGRIKQLTKEGREEFAGFLSVASAFAMIPDIKDVVDGKEGAVDKFIKKRDGIANIVDEYVNRKDEVEICQEK